MKTRIFLLAWLGLCFHGHAALDLDNDGLGDLWQMKYQADELSPTADSDGDGQSNAAEAAAGTNPLGANDIIRVSSMSRIGNQVTLQWPSIAGKKYQVECSSLLDEASWALVGNVQMGNDGDQSSTLTVTSSHQFFRVRVSDADSDNDGVTDWEEIQAGLNAHHAGAGSCNCGANCDCYPECHCADTDIEHLSYLLETPPYVSIVGVEVNAAEPGVQGGMQSGSLLLKRSGGLRAVQVALQKSGSAQNSDHQAIPSSIALAFGELSRSITVTPVADTLTESDEAVLLAVAPSTEYMIGSSPQSAVLIADAVTANGTGLWAEFFNELNNLNDTTNAPLFNNRIATRIDPQINYTWLSGTVQGVNSPAVGVNVDYFSSRWSGEVLPEFSQPYTFELIMNRGGRLWVNGELLINKWPGNGSSSASGTYTAVIDLVAGKRVPIVLEHWENTGDSSCQLRWQSANVTKALIPANRLFPQTAPQILSNASQLYLQNSGTKNFQVTASGKPSSFTAMGLPAGWMIHPTTGILSGPTTTAGNWSIPITASNEYGSGSAILELSIVATSGLITHETWTGVTPGATLSSFPWGSNPNTSSTLSIAEIASTETQGIAQRLRGYLTAPETGMYRFWISGNDAASLWISNDSEPINLFSRASTSQANTWQEWSNAAPSPILWLEAGKRYYFEARCINASADTHLSVGWLLPSAGGLDPMAATAPSEVIPSYALSPWLGTTQADLTGTLYTAQMAGQNGNVTGAYGNATLQMNQAETQAVLRFSYANLTAPKTGAHIHSSAHGGAIIFDIDTAEQENDGSYVWDIVPAGAVSVVDIRNVVKNAQAYINVHSATYPAGEISGIFRQQTGSQTFTPPLSPPSFTSDHSNRSAAVRFLTQSTFGATESDIQAVQSSGYEAWIDQQFTSPVSEHYPLVFASRNVSNPSSNTYTGSQLFNAWWKQSVTAPDQLRQRIAFALSQIFVVSETGPLDERSDALSDYYDMLLNNSFGNARTLIQDVSLHPAMGRYLDMLRNERPDKATGRIPNENYAREILQLFSVGLYRMHPDGSLMLDSTGQPIPTYGQEEIIGFAHAFTGWNYHQADVGGLKPTNWSPSSNWLLPMREVPARHDIGTKRLLNNVVLPGLPKITTSAGATIVLNPAASYSSTASVRDDDEFQNLPMQEMNATHDSIFNNPNLGPFLCSQLIQRLVTSTPSRAYIYRVSQVFANNGIGVRGDMKAVIKAILLDYEARSANVLNQQGFGKQKEPVIRVTNIARAFPTSVPVNMTYVQNDGFITFTTPTPHLFVSGSPITVEFSNTVSGATSPATSGSYAVTTSNTNPANNATVFSVRPREAPNGTFRQNGNVCTVTMANSHGLSNGAQVYVLFPAGTSESKLYTITYVSSSVFTITVDNSATITTAQNINIVRHTGGYTMAANSPLVSLITSTNHHMSTGDQVYISFAPVSGQTTTPSAGLYTVTVLDDRQFTIENAGAATFTSSRTGSIVMSPAAPELNFSGSATLGYSSFSMGDTDTDLGQTAMRSPTVFNFYMPDYQFPGTLASNGLITPEFQLSSDTNVIRQSNFIYNGILKPSTSNTIFSSFKNGSGAIGLDFRSWMGVRPGGSVAWTDNTNVAALVDELSVLLTANQLSTQAKQIIVTFVSNTANIAYTNGSATDAQKINRLRGIIHLITTSPDFTIQR
jgi:uncharacterized protein (DUF1800 family)